MTATDARPPGVWVVHVTTAGGADAELAADALWQAGAVAIEERPVAGGVVLLAAAQPGAGGTSGTGPGTLGTGPAGDPGPLVAAVGGRWPAEIVAVDLDAALDAWRPHARVMAAGRFVVRPPWVPRPTGASGDPGGSGPGAAPPVDVVIDPRDPVVAGGTGGTGDRGGTGGTGDRGGTGGTGGSGSVAGPVDVVIGTVDPGGSGGTGDPGDPGDPGGTGDSGGSGPGDAGGSGSGAGPVDVVIGPVDPGGPGDAGGSGSGAGPPVDVVIDPGRSFGSGAHASTRLALAALDAALRGGGERVLDVGTGSGVLAIAALLAGAGTAHGVDIDPAALAASRANAARNGIGDRLTVSREWPPADEPFDLVLANMLAPTLVELAAAIRARLRPAGTLILSGLLAEQRTAVLEAYTDLTVVRTHRDDGWVGLVLRR